MSKNSMTKKEEAKMLKDLGLPVDFLKRQGDLDSRIEQGKNKHRTFVQEIKNEEIKAKLAKNPFSVDRPEIFFYRGQENSEYTNLNSLLMNRKWEDDENDM
jgi:hypothetical protein